MRWVDTHLEAGTIEVLNQIVQYGWETGQAAPKTVESSTTVAFDAGTVVVLTAQKTRQRAEREAAGDGWVESGCSPSRTARRWPARPLPARR